MENKRIKPEKRLGQNFLKDEAVLKNIVEASKASKDDLIIEIGPGMGALTKELIKKAGFLVSIEIDERLFLLLEESFKKEENIKVLKEDFLKCDIKSLINEYKGELKSVKVVSNLPYYITSQILIKLLSEAAYDLYSITVMVQKEFSDRLLAAPGKKEYGAITLFSSYYSTVEEIMVVPPEAFFPPPKVYSSVIRLDIKKTPPVKTDDPEMLFKIIRAAFNQRRKTLVNSILNSPELSFERDEIERALISLSFDKTIRGERLSLEDFNNLKEELEKKD